MYSTVQVGSDLTPSPNRETHLSQALLTIHDHGFIHGARFVRPEARSSHSVSESPTAAEVSRVDPPKPLIKLDKKPKNKPQTAPAPHYVLSRTMRPSSSSKATDSESVESDTRRKQPESGSVAPLLNLRRPKKTGTESTPAIQLPPTGGHPDLDLEDSAGLQPITVQPRHARSDKAARMLGETAAGFPPSTLEPDCALDPPDADSLVSTQFSDGDKFGISSRTASDLLSVEEHEEEEEGSSSWRGEADSSAGGATSFKCIEESSELIEDSDCYRDDAYVQRNSALLLAPMEFRPPQYCDARHAARAYPERTHTRAVGRSRRAGLTGRPSSVVGPSRQTFCRLPDGTVTGRMSLVTDRQLTAVDGLTGWAGFMSGLGHNFGETTIK
ncbi:hypothetical protein GGX14DRAFT_395661 [Mycena pura]|uniref:Uncharacterized protein n=1 Tax=Mycena pura TaxID=153505 RepID=A0AAD6VBS9_9AGAR|nr:hypothetical protein GGX14DRAFT_395661 [Mycena pura]